MDTKLFKEINLAIERLDKAVQLLDVYAKKNEKQLNDSEIYVNVKVKMELIKSASVAVTSKLAKLSQVHFDKNPEEYKLLFFKYEINYNKHTVILKSIIEKLNDTENMDKLTDRIKVKIEKQEPLLQDI